MLASGRGTTCAHQADLQAYKKVEAGQYQAGRLDRMLLDQRWNI